MSPTQHVVHNFLRAHAGSSCSGFRILSGTGAPPGIACGCLIALLLLPIGASSARAGPEASEGTAVASAAADPARVTGPRADELWLTKDVAFAVLRANRGVADDRPAPLDKLQERVRRLRESVAILRKAEQVLLPGRRRPPIRSGGASPQELSARRDAAEQALRQEIERLGERRDEWAQYREAASTGRPGDFRPRLLAKLDGLELELEETLAESGLARVRRLHDLEKRLMVRATKRPRDSASQLFEDDTPTIQNVVRREKDNHR